MEGQITLLYYGIVNYSMEHKIQKIPKKGVRQKKGCAARAARAAHAFHMKPVWEALLRDRGSALMLGEFERRDLVFLRYTLP